MAELSALALLAEEMKEEDTVARITAMKRLRMVAAAMGPERARSELLPFLDEHMEEEDEVLLAMADELGRCVDFIGGPRFAPLLLQPLGTLCNTEETVVREKAVESLCAIIKMLDAATVLEHLPPLIQKLATGDWFTARVSACGLIPATYAGITDATTRTTLRQIYTSLTDDEETPMVKRAAAKALGQLAAAVEHDVVVTELLPLFNKLAGDDHDSVRIASLSNCAALGRVLTQAENRTHLLPMIKSCAGDKSWRIRNEVAREWTTLSEAVGIEAARVELLPLFVRLTSDPEAEVRTSVVKNLTTYSKMLGPETFLTSLLPAVRDLASDISQNVRSAAATAIMSITATLNRSQAEGTVVPLFMRLLTDNDAPEVRLQVLEGLEAVADTIGPEFLSSTLVPALLTLASDALWRVREKVIEKLPLMAKSLGPVVFEERLLKLYVGTYDDHVSSVRMAATRSLQAIARALGVTWFRSRMIPQLLSLYNADRSSYLRRITILYGIRELCSARDMSELSDDVMPLLIQGLRDPVPNVRFVAAQVVGDASICLDKTRMNNELRPLLNSCMSDADQDVRFYASYALQKM